jgi:hypothetical protein
MVREVMDSDDDILVFLSKCQSLRLNVGGPQPNSIKKAMKEI